MGVSEALLGPTVAFISTHPYIALCIAPLILVAIKYIYRLSYWHPLSHIPGPAYARFSSIYLNYHAYIGDESTAVHALHQKYGPIVRTGHNSIDIADGTALQSIYVEKGGFLKPDFYGNFDIDGHKSIFSAVDPVHRASRAKAVIGIFSTGNLRAGIDIIDEATDRFIARFRREKERAVRSRNSTSSGRKIDLLGICRALAIDIVTSYLFDLDYGACEEDVMHSEDVCVSDSPAGAREHMTASAMVDSFVAVGKFWYLEPGVFRVVDFLMAKIYPDRLADESIGLVDSFVEKAVKKTLMEKNQLSYPGRLLQAGFTESEVRAQCKDLIFAGTDSTAMNLATICFHLARNFDTYAKLKQEIEQSNPTSNDLQSLPYLRGVVKEGLRLAMANPSRLPRIVPPGGWTFSSTHIPPGTEVSCTPFELHLDPAVFTDPYSFRPERWLPENKPTEEMSRNHIAFGLGPRQCIARNLATVELFCGVKRIVEEDLLADLTTVKDKIEILEWFNSHVVGGRIEMRVGT